MNKNRLLYLFMVLSALVFVGCKGGGSSDGGTTPPPVDNNPPVADAGTDKYVFTSSSVTLDGSSSDDEDLDSITYSWTVSSKPDGSSATLSDDAIVNPTFTADIDGTYILQLIVNDGTEDSAPDTVTFTSATFSDVEEHNASFSDLDPDINHFSGSQNCALCHDGITNTNNEDVSIVKAWQGTMMANSATDPLYLAKVASEVQRNPHVKDVIENKCSRCHMPMANVEANLTDQKISMFDDGFLNSNNPHYDAAKEGVSCTLCHQIEPDPTLGTDEGFSGGFVIPENFGSERVTYGPYPNPVEGPMVSSQNKVDFTPVHSDHINDSKLCASCHNLNTPIINVQTKEINGSIFPEQAVYTEWEYSDFNDSNINTARSCQNCHMPITEGSVVISTKGPGLQDRSPFYQHKFLGANTYMLDILKNNRIKLGSKADPSRFDESITDTREFLKAAANVDISSPTFDNDTLEFSVLVTNHSGHKFPTSIPIRRAWLHVKVTDTNGQTVFESGAMNSSG